MIPRFSMGTFDSYSHNARSFNQDLNVLGEPFHDGKGRRSPVRAWFKAFASSCSGVWEPGACGVEELAGACFPSIAKAFVGEASLGCCPLLLPKALAKVAAENWVVAKNWFGACCGAPLGEKAVACCCCCCDVCGITCGVPATVWGTLPVVVQVVENPGGVHGIVPAAWPEEAPHRGFRWEASVGSHLAHGSQDPFIQA